MSDENSERLQPVQKIDRGSRKNHEIRSQLVSRDVIYCVSSLIYELSRIDECMDEISEVIGRPDYVAAVENCDYVEVYYDDERGGYAFKYDEDGEEPEVSDEVYDTEEQACEAAVSEYDLDYDYLEAYEHWIVTEWLAEKLKARGEIVGEVYGLTIWGRCATGQAISMDGIIGEIAEDMEILEGQKWDWSRKD